MQHNNLASNILDTNTATLVDILRWRAENQPDKIIYNFMAGGDEITERYTYAEMDKNVRTIAAFLQSQGHKGDRVMLLFPPGLNFIASYFACLYAGMIAIPLHPHLRPKKDKILDKIIGVAKDAEPVMVLNNNAVEKAKAGLFELAPEMAELPWANIEELDINMADNWQNANVVHDDLAFLQYTSGSTGDPKGVMVNHGNLIANLEQITHPFGIHDGTKVLSWLPPYHDMGLIGGLLQGMYSGFPVYFMAPVTFLQRPFRWLQAVAKHKITIMGGPNFAYDYAVDRIKSDKRDLLDLSTIENAFCGAEPIHATTVRRFTEYFAPVGFSAKAFYPCYGMAETTLMVTGDTVSASPAIHSFDAAALEQRKVIQVQENEVNSRVLIGCGKLVKNMVMKIVDPDTMQECAPDAIGEIWLQGNNVAQGYWKKEEKTKETFQAYITDTTEGPFLRTGDLGFVYEGQLYVSGRIKDIIIIDGRNHYPQDIEKTAEASHIAVTNNATGAFSIEKDNAEKLVVAIELDRRALRNSENTTQEDVVKAIKQAVSREHEINVYDVFIVPKRIPKTTSGKIQRYQCKLMYLD